MNVYNELTTKMVSGATRSEIEAAAAECKSALIAPAIKAINLDILRAAWKTAPSVRAMSTAPVAVATRTDCAGAICARCHGYCYGDCTLEAA